MGIERFLTSREAGAALRRALPAAAIAAIVGFAGVFTLPPLDRDESRFAQASAQMLESGDFLIIRFQDEERNKKPAGAYWLQAASVAAFSTVDAREIWAYRLPSVFGAVLAAIFTYAAIARLFEPASGMIAAVLLATAPVVAAEATIAKTDALLLACVTGAAAALAHLMSAAREGRKTSLLLAGLFWIAVGAGILIKGPIIVLVLAPAIALIAARFPQTQPLRTLRPVLGVFILILMVGPWAAAIDAATEGRFFAQAVGADMIAKIGAAQESHAGPPGYHLLLAPVLAWPLAALAPAGFAAALAARRDFAAWFLISWLVPGWLIFELTATKLPHYVLPLYPALAGIAAAVATKQLSAPVMLWRAGAVIYGAVGLGLAAAIALIALRFGADNIHIGAAAAAVMLAAATIWASSLFWRRIALKGVVIAAATSSFLAVTILTMVMPQLQEFAVSPRLSKALDDLQLHPLHDGAPPASLAGYSEPSAVFLLGTKTRLSDGAKAADALIDHGGAAIIEARERKAFDARLVERGASALARAEIDGVNYSKGTRVHLTVFQTMESRAKP